MLPGVIMHRTVAISLLAAAVLFPPTASRAQDTIIRNAPPTELMRGMLSHTKSMVRSADGRLWALTWNDTKKTGSIDKDRHLLLCASSDGGKSWSVMTDTRSIGDTYGSITTGPLGRRLHITWYGNNGKKISTKWINSVFYASFDTATDKWEGTADTVIRAGLSDREQYTDPDIVAAADGTIAVSFGNRYVAPSGSVGVAGSWCSYLVWNKGSGWSKPHRINVNGSGISVDLNYNVRNHGIDMCYRITTGGYGTGYRHFDIATEKFGSEIAIPQLAAAKGKYHGNRNHLAFDANGDIWVLYVRNNQSSSPTVSELRIAYLKQGATAFSKDLLVTTDTYGMGGNVSSYNYSLSTLPNGTVWALYSLKKETWQNLYGRIVKTTALTPQLTLRKGSRTSQYAWVAGHRPTLQGGGLHAMVTDFSAIGALVGGRNLFIGPVSGTVLRHGSGCGTKSIATPELYPVEAPMLGGKLSMLATDHPANTSGILLLGATDKKFGPFNLPLPLGGLGMPGCQLWQDVVTTGLYSCNQAGQATIVLPFPVIPSLAGVPIFFQGIAVAPTANKANLLATNGLTSIAH
jgi:hypothetical protein